MQGVEIRLLLTTVNAAVCLKFSTYRFGVGRLSQCDNKGKTENVKSNNAKKKELARSLFVAKDGYFAGDRRNIDRSLAATSRLHTCLSFILCDQQHF